MFSFWVRYMMVKVKYWFTEKLPWSIAYLVPRKVALYCFVRVYSTIGDVSSDYKLAYNNWVAGKGR